MPKKTFLSSLYLKPKMEIYLRQSLIRPTRVQDLMYERRRFVLPQQKFRSIAKTRIAEWNAKKKKLELKCRKAKGEAVDLQKKVGDKASPEKLKELRQKNMAIEKIQAEIHNVESKIKNGTKASEVKDFNMYLGYNIRDRRSSGLRLFNKNRLIVEVDGKQWSQWPLGVIASVDVPASLMQPAMSKQRFNDDREFKILQKFCLERARDYAKRVYMNFDQWEKFGYSNSCVDQEPNISPEVERSLNYALPQVYRCTECGKYRVIPPDQLAELDPALFTCSDLRDSHYNTCDKKEKDLNSKLLELVPPVKTERPDSDVEEVAVSPERKKLKKPLNGQHLSRKRIQDSDDDSDAPVVNRRLRRKRRSGHGRHGGNEVTSGFDRHRMVSSDSDDSDDDEDQQPKKKNAKHIDNDDSRSEKINEEMESLKREHDDMKRRLREQDEKNKLLIEEMRACVKHFYPTSWKQSDAHSHREIETWDHDTISRNSKNWKESYTRDLKSIVSTCERKKALKAKIDVADQLLGLENKDDLLRKIKTLKAEAAQELKKLKEQKS